MPAIIRILSHHDSIHCSTMSHSKTISITIPAKDDCQSINFSPPIVHCNQSKPRLNLFMHGKTKWRTTRSDHHKSSLPLFCVWPDLESTSSLLIVEHTTAIQPLSFDPLRNAIPIDSLPRAPSGSPQPPQTVTQSATSTGPHQVLVDMQPKLQRLHNNVQSIWRSSTITLKIHRRGASCLPVTRWYHPQAQSLTHSVLAQWCYSVERLPPIMLGPKENKKRMAQWWFPYTK